MRFDDETPMSVVKAAIVLVTCSARACLVVKCGWTIISPSRATRRGPFGTSAAAVRWRAVAFSSRATPVSEDTTRAAAPLERQLASRGSRSRLSSSGMSESRTFAGSKETPIWWPYGLATSSGASWLATSSPDGWEPCWIRTGADSMRWTRRAAREAAAVVMRGSTGAVFSVTVRSPASAAWPIAASVAASAKPTPGFDG